MNLGGTIRTLLITTAICVAGCQKKASDEIDFGSIENSVYSNEYFGLKVTLPADWTVQDQEAQRKLSEDGARMLAGDDKNLKAAMRASELQTVNLFMVFKHPVGAPVDFNPSIMGMAERIRHMPGIKKGKDYLFHVKKALQAGQLKVSVTNEMSKEQIAGRDFDVMHTEIPGGEMRIHQKYYATVIKGYALVFIASFSADEEQSALKDILKSATIN